jgi:AcrR family transcriptional regulator
VSVEGEPSGRVARRKARTAQAILDAAEAMFRERGFVAARVEEIAEAADVSVGSLYGYFGDKGGIYRALAERSADAFAGYLAQAYDPALRPIEQVIAAGDAYLQFHIDHPGAFRFLAAPWPGAAPERDGGEIGRRIADRLEDILGGFAAVIQRAIDAGEAQAIDPRMLALFLWGAWNGVVELTTRPDRLRLSEEEVAAALHLGRRIVLEGLAAPALRDADGRLRDVRIPHVAPPRDAQT